MNLSQVSQETPKALDLSTFWDHPYRICCPSRQEWQLNMVNPVENKKSIIEKQCIKFQLHKSAANIQNK